MTAPPPIQLTRDALFERVWREPLSAVARQLGLSASGLAKICDRTSIPYPSRGHWGKVKAGRAPSPPPLPPAPDGVENVLRIAPGRMVARRASSRLPLEERRAHLLDAAAQIIVREGLHAVSIKRVARDVGLTAPRAYHFFPSVDDLLVELARRELQAVRAAQQQRIDTATRPAERLRLSTVTYLREIASRGGLLQVLQAAPAVRKGLRREQRALRAANTEVVAGRFSHSHGVPEDVARAATMVLTSAVLRTGRMIARGRLGLDVAENLAAEIVEAGNRRLAARFQAASAGDVDHA
ncbi:TetR/AcrR family transcriptional regulator [Phenylobacterium sp.]|uniref:TetR/AcrR family transcriptional regulator n=1 Tax=Phenylobacterium sp. TaxID=1871053 RepID=UPI00289CC074|nr:TetR/AcrR family transcriptional regulator [Phenylobacterium sp.]